MYRLINLFLTINYEIFHCILHNIAINYSIIIDKESNKNAC